MKADCVEIDSGTLTGFQQVLVKPLPDRLHFRRFRHPSMILAGHDEQSRLDAGRLELWHDPMRLLKRTLHRQAQLIPHARKQLQVCTKMQRTKKRAQRRVGGVVTGPGGTEDMPHSDSGGLLEAL